MAGISTREHHGEAVTVGATTAVPVVKEWRVTAGRREWTAGGLYAAPAIDVTGSDGVTRRVAVPDVGLWVRIGAVALAMLVALGMGGRR